MTPQTVVSIDTLVVDDVHFDPKVFEAALTRELAACLAGRASSEREPSRVRTSEGAGLTVATTVYRELSR